MLHKCNVWQTQRAMKAMALFCTEPAPFPQAGRAPHCHCWRLSAPNKLANCFNTRLQLRKLRHRTVKCLFLWGLSSKARHPKFYCQFQLGVTLHNPWLHGCCHTLSPKPWGHSPGISWGQRRRMLWMGSGDAAAHQSLGKGPQRCCMATGTGSRCADMNSLCPQKGSHLSEGWRPHLFPFLSQALLRNSNFLEKWQDSASHNAFLQGLLH